MKVHLKLEMGILFIISDCALSLIIPYNNVSSRDQISGKDIKVFCDAQNCLC